MNFLQVLNTRAAVLVMLALQILVFFVGMLGHYEITIFCTGPADGGWAQQAFGLLHITFLGLLALGLTSLAWRVARPVYVILIFLGLAALPVQAEMLHSQVLQCDLP